MARELNNLKTIAPMIKIFRKELYLNSYLIFRLLNNVVKSKFKEKNQEFNRGIDYGRKKESMG